MTKKLFPTYDICNLNTEKNSNELFSVDRFRGYVDSGYPNESSRVRKGI